MCAVFFTALKLMDGNPAGILPFLQASQTERLLLCWHPATCLPAQHPAARLATHALRICTCLASLLRRLVPTSAGEVAAHGVHQHGRCGKAREFQPRSACYWAAAAVAPTLNTT